MRARLLVAAAGLFLAAGAGAVVAGHGDPTTCDGRTATIVGTSGNDDLVGTPGPDVIAALDGTDVVAGLGGEDVLCGGGGADWLRGGDDADRLDGGAGADRLDGGPGRDAVWSEAAVPDRRADLRISVGEDVLAHVEALDDASRHP
jgi:Ca2+-binding RTX toxin-like protein